MEPKRWERVAISPRSLRLVRGKRTGYWPIKAVALPWCLNLLKLNKVKEGYIYTFRSTAASDCQ